MLIENTIQLNFFSIMQTQQNELHCGLSMKENLDNIEAEHETRTHKRINYNKLFYYEIKIMSTNVESILK